MAANDGSAEKQVPEYLDLVNKVNRLEAILKRSTKQYKKEVKQLLSEVRYELMANSNCDTEEEDENGSIDTIDTIDSFWPPEAKVHVPQQLNNRTVVRIKPEPLFWLKYNSAKDTYESSEKVFQGKCFSELIYEGENLEFGRDIERVSCYDATFVSRCEGCSNELDGIVRWRFDLSDLDGWQRVEVQANGKLSPGTKISFYALSLDANLCPLARIELRVNNLNTMTANELNASSIAKMVDLVAILSGDSNPKEKRSWQRPQLFRQYIHHSNQENYWPFTFFIH